MSLRAIDSQTAVVTTTDATVTTILSWTIPDGSSAYVEATIIGRDSSGNTTIKKIAACVKRNSGNASMVSSVQIIVPLVADVALLTVVATLDVSSPSVRVRVTGVIATTIEWFCELKVIST